ncbi:MAG: PTS sugar transporter subunit IIA [Halorhodospira sp.]
MRVGLLIVCHRHIGTEILATASRTLGVCPLQTESLEVLNEDELTELIDRAGDVIERLDQGSGVLILTDAYGSTPSNVAVTASHGRTCRVVTGINLPMLLRVFNYPGRSLEALADCAAAGGRAGIIEVDDGANPS